MILKGTKLILFKLLTNFKDKNNEIKKNQHTKLYSTLKSVFLTIHTKPQNPINFYFHYKKLFISCFVF